MWTVIYVAYDENEAQTIEDKLVSEGFLVKIKNLGNENDSMVEILVPESEADEAHDVINQNF